MSKYHFYNSKDKVVAVSTYAGKPVRGIAKCDPADTFSLEYGQKLAAARCNEKVAGKRLKRAESKFVEACHNYLAAQRRMESMREYFADARNSLDEARANVANLLSNLAP